MPGIVLARAPERFPQGDINGMAAPAPAAVGRAMGLRLRPVLQGFGEPGIGYPPTADTRGCARRCCCKVVGGALGPASVGLLCGRAVRVLEPIVELLLFVRSTAGTPHAGSGISGGPLLRGRLTGEFVAPGLSRREVLRLSAATAGTAVATGPAPAPLHLWPETIAAVRMPRNGTCCTGVCGAERLWRAD